MPLIGSIRSLQQLTQNIQLNSRHSSSNTQNLYLQMRVSDLASCLMQPFAQSLLTVFLRKRSCFACRTLFTSQVLYRAYFITQDLAEKKLRCYSLYRESVYSLEPMELVCRCLRKAEVKKMSL